jgi:hypothetical protein
MQRMLIQNLLTEVAHELVVKIHKKRLLWMLGYKYDKESAWAELLEMWTELGFDKDCLYGTEEADQIVLVSVTSSIEPVKKWA